VGGGGGEGKSHNNCCRYDLLPFYNLYLHFAKRMKFSDCALELSSGQPREAACNWLWPDRGFPVFGYHPPSSPSFPILGTVLPASDPYASHHIRPASGTHSLPLRAALYFSSSASHFPQYIHCITLWVYGICHPRGDKIIMHWSNNGQICSSGKLVTDDICCGSKGRAPAILAAITIIIIIPWRNLCRHSWRGLTHKAPQILTSTRW